MTTIIIITTLIFILIVGFVKVYKQDRNLKKDHEFAFNYRNKFVQFANNYSKGYDRWSRTGNIDSELYVWLTKNVSKMQSDVGIFGYMDYIAPFQTYQVSNYQIIVNTIPKFRDGQIQDFDINSVDDCLLRYLGFLEERSNSTQKNLRNPIIWFRIGFQEIISISLFILNWFGIFSTKTVNSIMNSVIYKILTGIIALVTLFSGLVTIIQGKEKTIEIINSFLNK